MSSSPLSGLSVIALVALVGLALTPWVIAGYGFGQLLSN